MNEIISYGRFQCSELTPHKNRGMEITYIEKGVMEWMVEGNPEKIEAGSIFFTLPWQVHGSLNPKEPDNTIWHVLFHLERDYPAPHPNIRFPKSFGFLPQEMEILAETFASSTRHCFRATPAMRSLMPTLIGELQSTHELRDAHAITLLRAILVELKRIVAGEVVDAGIRNRSEQKVQKLISDLSAKCDHDWSLGKMAEQCGIQRTQLGKLFQKLTGGTPMEYLTRIRIERAKALLRETDLKIIEIALECGYGSSQYFANTFRQATGQSPSEYRTQDNWFSAADTQNWKNLPFRSEEEEHARIKRFEDD